MYVQKVKRPSKTYSYLRFGLPVHLPEIKQAMKDMERMCLTPSQFVTRLLWEKYNK